MNEEIKKIQGEELLKETVIENTPFSVIEFEEKFYVSMGKYARVSEAFETFKLAEKDAKSITWNRIMQILNFIERNKN